MCLVQPSLDAAQRKRTRERGEEAERDRKARKLQVMDPSRRPGALPLVEPDNGSWLLLPAQAGPIQPGTRCTACMLSCNMLAKTCHLA